MEHRYVIFCAGALFVVGLVSGCGKSDNHWRDPVNELNQGRRGYVEAQAEHGVSELDAKRAWDQDRMIGNTHGGFKGIEIAPDEALR